jgi:uncharacterized protein (TIGR00255 family)
MIRSMTGYGRAEVSGRRAALWIECKSLNHRSLDVVVRLPRSLSALELDARRTVQQTLKRGRVEVSGGLSGVGGGTLEPLSVNVVQAREYASAARRVAAEIGLPGEPGLAWVLDQPGVLTRSEEAALGSDEGATLLAGALAQALAELVARREAEGAALAQELARLHDELARQVGLIAERAPAALARRTLRLRERVAALRGDAPVDEGRLATEIALLAERTDVTEEIARLGAHLDQLALLRAGEGAVGRTMEFLIQEMGREVNTIGAKADDLEISQMVIAAKSHLEKLREQVQNVE